MTTTVEIGPGSEARQMTVNGQELEIIPLGSGCEVGRSCIILKIKGKTIMFDCGVHPGYSGISSLPYFDEVNPEDVNVLLMTHFHLDHSGAVPYFVNKTSFAGRVFMTHPTKPICKLLWQDFARVSKISNQQSAIYTKQDIDKTMQRIDVIDFHQELEHEGIRFSCYGAGHVLGACMFVVEVAGLRVLYTGDFSREIDKHMPVAEVPDQDIHVLIVESTYGVQVHEPRPQREARFTNLVHQIVKQGGKCLLPVFALGRAQEMLLILDDYWAKNPELHNIPIYYNSPMTNKCMRIFETYTSMCSQAVQDQANNCLNPWFFNYVQDLPSADLKELASDDAGPCVVMVAPGMLQNGPSRLLFEAWCTNKRNGVIMTGYTVPGTLGYQLKQEPDYIQIEDRSVRLACTVKFISFSAHSDFNQTRDFIQGLKTNNVVLCHGEITGMKALSRKLKDEYPDIKICNPRNCESVVFQFPADEAVDYTTAADNLDELDAMVSGDSRKNKADDDGAAGKSKKRKMIRGVLIESPDGSRIVVNPAETGKHVPVRMATLQQSQRVPCQPDFTLEDAYPAIKKVYEECEKHADRLMVGDCVTISRQGNELVFEWTASPVSDMIADSASFITLDTIQRWEKSKASGVARPSAFPPKGPDAQTQTLFQVLKAYCEVNYGSCDIDADSKRITFETKGNQIIVDVAKREVSGEDEGVVLKVQNQLGYCEAALTPAVTSLGMK